MASALERPKPGSIPDAPGCYVFRDADGRAIYVGKARSLRARLGNYFTTGLHPRTAMMIEHAASVEWIITQSEVASLHLEFTLIKEHAPRFNVKYRDDKSYPYLAITVGEEVPRATVMRGSRRPGVRQFGPYAQAYAIRETLDLLLRTFPVRTCSKGVFERARRAKRACLLYDIGKCAAPCVGTVSGDEHRAIVDGLIGFLDGAQDVVVRRLDVEMRAAAADEEFERAARLRDQLAAVQRVVEKQTVVFDSDDDLDVVGIEEDDIEAAFQIFIVRGGRLTGRTGAIIDKVEDLDTPALVTAFLRDRYLTEDVPPLILVPTMPDEEAALTALLRERRGGRFAIKLPLRGSRRELLETATVNAKEAFLQHKLRRRSDFAARAAALTALQEELGLDEAPLRIECFDISNIGASDKVGSMVVFEDGLPKRQDYRKFKIKGVEGQDDFASMAEVIRRRFTAYLAESREPIADGKPKRFAYAPNLVVIDGGWGQLDAARRVLDDLGLAHIVAVGLMKRFEEVAMPGSREPVRVTRGSDALYLLQHIRDEAHRVAISYHRTLRRKSTTASELDRVPGVGPARKRALLRTFGSVRRILAAPESEVAEVVPPDVARRVQAVLRGMSDR